MKDPRRVYVRYSATGDILGVEAILAGAPSKLRISPLPGAIDEAALIEIDATKHRDPAALIDKYVVAGGKLRTKAVKMDRG